MRRLVKRISLLAVLAVATLQPAWAGGPRYSNAGGIGSATSSYTVAGGEPTGGAYSINGATGAATFGSLSLTGSQGAGKVLAAPAGAPGAPTWRSITTADLPIGTTGATIPLLNGTNNFNGFQSSFTGDGFPDNVPGGQFTMSYLQSISRLFANSAAYGVSGMVVNHNTTSVGYPTGVVGYAQMDAAGNQGYGMNAVTDCMAVGICSNEFDANNFSSQDSPNTFPPDYSYPTTHTYAQGLYLGAGGTKKDYFALGIGPNGFTPSTWNAGIWMVPGSVNYYGMLIGGTPTASPQYSIYSQNTGQGPNVNLVLQTTGGYVENNAVISLQDSGGVAHFFVQQSGATHIISPSTSDNQTLSVSAVSDANGANISLTGDGSTTPSKTIRVHAGVFAILNSAYSTGILVLDDSGNETIPAAMSAASYKVGSTAGVSCAAGTVNLTTFAVTNGIVTHC